MGGHIDPRAKTLSQLAKRTIGTWRASIGWLAIVSFVFSLVLAIYANDGALFSRTIGGTLTFTVGVLIWVFGIHYFCKVVYHRKTNYYEALLYLMVSIYTVAIILFVILSLLPVANGMLGYVGCVYLVVLAMIAVRAVTKLIWWKTCVSVVVSSIVALVCTIAFPVFITNLPYVMRSMF